jgi:cob(I)alamin adenosyltransferase
MLYTGKGDKGETKTYGCNQKITKSSAVAEALGSLDEINSYLGVLKVLADTTDLRARFSEFPKLLHGVQETLFMVQAGVAGFPMKVPTKKVKELEDYINKAEKELPKIKTFFISGGTLLASNLDVARTIARRAERRVVAVKDEGKQEIDENALAFLNRLSSLLYAMARLANHRCGISDVPPSYK